VEAFNERYLRLPTAMGRLTSGVFHHLGERICSKLQGGSERLFHVGEGNISEGSNSFYTSPNYVFLLAIKEGMQTINFLYGKILVEQLT
jgi:hypothetical protein